MPIWDAFLSERDRRIFGSAGYGKRAGFGKRPVVLVIDVNYNFVGDRAEPIEESVKRRRTSRGEEGWRAIEGIRRLTDAARERGIPVIYSTGMDLRPDGWDAGRWGDKNARTREDVTVNADLGNTIAPPNGENQRVRALAEHTLLQVLRDSLKLFGVREGCGVGMCGACTVLVDGKAVSSCLILAPLAVGKHILTIEGLESANGALHPIQQAFADYTAFQCSYCTPGFILSTQALLEEDPNPTEAGVRSYLAGNLCRCGSYAKIIAAVLDARDRQRHG